MSLLMRILRVLPVYNSSSGTANRCSIGGGFLGPLCICLPMPATTQHNQSQRWPEHAIYIAVNWLGAWWGSTLQCPAAAEHADVRHGGPGQRCTLHLCRTQVEKSCFSVPVHAVLPIAVHAVLLVAVTKSDKAPCLQSVQVHIVAALEHLYRLWTSTNPGHRLLPKLAMHSILSSFA